jgi:proteasome lid subunit RPN8/RPN11
MNEAEAAVQATPADPQRDAENVAKEHWPSLNMPGRVPGRTNKYQVLFRRSVLNDIRSHGLTNPDVEVCGVLVGDIYCDAQGPWCFVEANIRGNYASGRNAQVTFTSETWTQIHQEMDDKYADKRILGWYHTHPGFGIFLSEMDVFIQDNFFSQLWQIAFVDDPKGGDRGSFVWRKGVPVREEYLVDEDVPEHSPLAKGGQYDAAPPEEEAAAIEPHAASRRRRMLMWSFVIGDVVLLAAVAALVWWWRQ